MRPSLFRQRNHFDCKDTAKEFHSFHKPKQLFSNTSRLLKCHQRKEINCRIHLSLGVVLRFICGTFNFHLLACFTALFMTLWEVQSETERDIHMMSMHRNIYLWAVPEIAIFWPNRLLALKNLWSAQVSEGHQTERNIVGSQTDKFRSTRNPVQIASEQQKQS